MVMMQVTLLRMMYILEDERMTMMVIIIIMTMTMRMNTKYVDNVHWHPHFGRNPSQLISLMWG